MCLIVSKQKGKWSRGVSFPLDSYPLLSPFIFALSFIAQCYTLGGCIRSTAFTFLSGANVLLVFSFTATSFYIHVLVNGLQGTLWSAFKCLFIIERATSKVPNPRKFG